MRLRLFSLIAILTLATPLGAQAGLEARMQALLDTLAEGSTAGAAAFFPRRGEWAMVTTWRGGPAGVRTRARRFSGAETPRIIGPGGELCDSFTRPGGEYGPPEGVLAMQAMMHRSGWRRVRGSRFVPPGKDASSGSFVEWRREDGAWVVAAFGEEHRHFPRVLGTPVGMITRDTVPPAGVAYAADAPWFARNEPITFEGFRYIRYGNPRAVLPDTMARIGSLGRIPVYAPAGHTRAPQLLVLPVRPGEFQLYEGFRPSAGTCR